MGFAAHATDSASPGEGLQCKLYFADFAYMFVVQPVREGGATDGWTPVPSWAKLAKIDLRP